MEQAQNRRTQRVTDRTELGRCREREPVGKLEPTAAHLLMDRVLRFLGEV